MAARRIASGVNFAGGGGANYFVHVRLRALPSAAKPNPAKPRPLIRLGPLLALFLPVPVRLRDDRHSRHCELRTGLRPTPFERNEQDFRASKINGLSNSFLFSAK
jgi:hypothetical protein